MWLNSITIFSFFQINIGANVSLTLLCPCQCFLTCNLDRISDITNNKQFNISIHKTTTQLNSTHYTLSGGLSGASASATNCGPSAEPPIPTESIWVNLPSGDEGGLIYQNQTKHNDINKSTHPHKQNKLVLKIVNMSKKYSLIFVNRQIHTYNFKRI
jgi:hypothetical protein